MTHDAAGLIGCCARSEFKQMRVLRKGGYKWRLQVAQDLELELELRKIDARES